MVSQLIVYLYLPLVDKERMEKQKSMLPTIVTVKEYMNDVSIGWYSMLDIEEDMKMDTLWI